MVGGFDPFDVLGVQHLSREDVARPREERWRSCTHWLEYTSTRKIRAIPRRFRYNRRHGNTSPQLPCRSSAAVRAAVRRSPGGTRRAAGLVVFRGLRRGGAGG